jgi:PAT family beta-lactamase induction signal transducer AmpG
MNALLQSLLPLRDRRFLIIFMLGFSSGFPWVLHGSVLTLWMQSEGLSRSHIGFIGGVTAIYALNWLWSPLVDTVRLPWLYRRFGQRRSWILLTQALLIFCIFFLSFARPEQNLWLLGLLALGVALASATQDIAVDAYRINIFSRAEFDAKLPYSSAMATTGWWAGYGFIGGALALWLGGESIGLSWPAVYRVLLCLYLLLMLFVTMVPEPGPDKDAETVTETNAAAVAAAPPWRGLQYWLQDTVVRPFTEFFERCGLQLAVAILLFLFSFRIGEAMLGRMSLVFYVELGFSTEEIALYQKFLGGLSLLGAFINTRYGVIRGMLVGGIAMAASNLMYAVMATVGPEPWLFLLTLLVDNFCNAFATVAVVSFISYFASRTYTGTQFALMTSFSNFGRTTLAAGSGAIVDALDGNWPLFFIMTTLVVIPSLLLLVWMGRMLEDYRSEQASLSDINRQSPQT